MGIDLRAQTNVHVDTEVRELKTPRAFCAPVRVPDEIYLVVLPRGGQDDYGALLHEAGHTEHFAHVAPDLAFEYRHFGDNAVTEAFAFLFDHLLLNRAWLGRHLDFADCDDFLRFATVSDLFYLRRLRRQARLRDRAPRLRGSARRDGRDLSPAPERGDHDRRAGRELPRRRRPRRSTRPTTCAPGCSRAPCA